jgi:hypothetical protein
MKLVSQRHKPGSRPRGLLNHGGAYFHQRIRPGSSQCERDRKDGRRENIEKSFPPSYFPELLQVAMKGRSRLRMAEQPTKAFEGKEGKTNCEY